MKLFSVTEWKDVEWKLVNYVLLWIGVGLFVIIMATIAGAKVKFLYLDWKAKKYNRLVIRRHALELWVPTEFKKSAQDGVISKAIYGEGSGAKCWSSDITKACLLLYNALPVTIKTAYSLAVFKKRFKTYLFTKAYMV